MIGATLRSWHSRAMHVVHLHRFAASCVKCGPATSSASGARAALHRAILDAVHGRLGYVDGHIIRKLFLTGARTEEDYRDVALGC